MIRQYKVTYRDGVGKCHAIRCAGKYATVITVDRYSALGYKIVNVHCVGSGKYTV